MTLNIIKYIGECKPDNRKIISPSVFKCDLYSSNEFVYRMPHKTYTRLI